MLPLPTLTATATANSHRWVYRLLVKTLKFDGAAAWVSSSLLYLSYSPATVVI